MTNEEKLERMIKSYNFTVTALCISILAIFAMFAVVITLYVPQMIAEQREENAPRIVKQALEDYFADKEFVTTE